MCDISPEWMKGKVMSGKHYRKDDSWNKSRKIGSYSEYKRMGKQDMWKHEDTKGKGTS